MVGQHPDAGQRARGEHPVARAWRTSRRSCWSSRSRGSTARIDFCKRLEANYGKSRQADSERPLVKIDGTPRRRYDRDLRQGGLGLLDAAEPDGPRAGPCTASRAFIKTYHGNPDHPVLQDFLAVDAPVRRDPPAFDAFTRQWFFEVVVPEYRLSRAEEDAPRVTPGR